MALLERIGRNGSIDRLFKLRPDTQHVSEYAGNISALPAYRLIQNVSGLYKGLANNKRSKAQSLEHLICYLVVFECSEPRDVIYAVLGIASDVRPIPFNISAATSQPSSAATSQTNSAANTAQPSSTAIGRAYSDERDPFEVNYEEDTLGVYKRFLEHAIKRSRSLDILCRPWAPANILDKDNPPATIKLPSWILDATRKPFRATVQGKMVRYNPDPFVGAAVSRGNVYAASGRCERGNENHPFTFEIDQTRGSTAITVQGFQLGAPSEIWDLAVHGSIPASWLKGAKWDKASKPPPDELWRTLVADRTSIGIEPEPVYPSVIQYAALEKGVEYGINTNEFLHETDNMAYYDVFRRVQAVVWNRKLIRAVLGKEYDMEPCLGLVPAETRANDLIYIVNGCSVPLVLRRRPAGGTMTNKGRNDSDIGEGKGGTKEGKGGDEGGKAKDVKDEVLHAELIGECYINNMMDGRAVKGEHAWHSIVIE